MGQNDLAHAKTSPQKLVGVVKGRASYSVWTPLQAAGIVGPVSSLTRTNPCLFGLRSMRSTSLRWAVAMALIPLLVLSLFGGAAFLVHDHDDHGAHAHAAGADSGPFTASEHLAAHQRESESGDPVYPDSERDLPALLVEVDGLRVCILDHEQVIARGMSAASLLSHLRLACTVIVLRWIPPDVVDDAGCRSRGPRHLCALTAGQRLLRTSQALLI